jgi:hypothetical protein
MEFASTFRLFRAASSSQLPLSFIPAEASLLRPRSVALQPALEARYPYSRKFELLSQMSRESEKHSYFNLSS